MTIRKRLERLERAVTARSAVSRCQHCRDWAWNHVEVKTVAELLAGDTWTNEVVRCPACGWSPNSIHEVILDTKEELAALECYQQLTGQSLGSCPRTAEAHRPQTPPLLPATTG